MIRMCKSTCHVLGGGYPLHAETCLSSIFHKIFKFSYTAEYKYGIVHMPGYFIVAMYIYKDWRRSLIILTDLLESIKR